MMMVDNVTVASLWKENFRMSLSVCPLTAKGKLNSIVRRTEVSFIFNCEGKSSWCAFIPM